MTYSHDEADRTALLKPRPWAASITIIVAALLTLALPLAAPTLNAIGISGLPLGYYLAAQGSLIFVALLGIWLSGPWRDWPIGERLGALLSSFTATGSWLTVGFAMTLIGGLFVFGHDGLPLLLGLASGLLVSLVFIAPALDRTGALHVDDLLARLTASGLVAAVVGLAMAAGLVMLISIEFEVVYLSLAAAGFSSGLAESTVVGGASLLTAVLALMPGKWLRALLTATAFMVTAAGLWFVIWAIAGRPSDAFLPQLFYSQAFADVTRIERGLLMEGLADPVSMPPFGRPFVQVSWLNFLALTISMLFGASVLPHMLWRRKAAAAKPSDFEASTGDFYPSRHKAAFGLIAAALVLSALPAAAVLTKLELYKAVASGIEKEARPGWMQEASQAGYLRVCREPLVDGNSTGRGDITSSDNQGVELECGDPSGRIRIADLEINPAAVVLLMPQLAGFPATMTRAFAAIVALLALFAASTTLRMATESAAGWLPTRGSPRIAVSDSSSAHDTVTVPASSPSIAVRLLTAILLAALGAACVVVLKESAVNRLYWAFAILGASVFPMVFLTAVMPRINGIALALGGLTGLSLCLYYVLGTASFFAPQFALLWQSISDSPPWLLEELDQLMKACAAGGADAFEACRNAAPMGRELANWFGIDGRAGAVLAAPVGLLVALILALMLPSSPHHYHKD